MRNVYITIIVLLALCITSLVASFFWLDKIRHKIFYYTVELEKKPFGFIKTERFLTEDRLMYKSAARMPFEHIYTDRLARLALNKDYILDEYSENNSGSGSRERCLIRNINGSVSLVHTEGPRFSYMEKMPVKMFTFITFMTLSFEMTDSINKKTTKANGVEPTLQNKPVSALFAKFFLRTELMLNPPCAP